MNNGVITSFAGVAELADALDLGSSAARRGGSIPLVRTIITQFNITTDFLPVSRSEEIHK